MALTDFGSLTAARKRVWAITAWRQGLDESFWNATGMVGREDNKPVQMITELTATERGDQCIIQLVAELSGDGIAGDNMLEGNEEPLINDAQTIQLDLLRNAVKSKGKMSEQRTVLRFRAQAKSKLTYWLANKLDEMAFLTASGRAYTLNLDGSTRSGSSQLPLLSFASDVTAASSARVMHAGAATSEATITAADTMSWNFLVKVQAFAKRRRMRPIRAEGRSYYAVVMSTEQAKDLKSDATYQTNVGRGGTAGGANPLFKGNFANVDGLLLFEHPKVFNTFGLASASKWGAGGLVDGAQALLLGAQGLGFARINEAEWEESDQRDYKNRVGIGYGRIVGYKKPVFRSIYDAATAQDFGIIAVKTAAAQIV